MKKFIFGCILMLCGVIGGTGWLIAKMLLVQPGAWSTVFGIFHVGDLEGYIVMVFYIIAIVGMVIAIKSMREDK